MEKKRQELLAEIKEMEQVFGRRYLKRRHSKDAKHYWDLKATLASIELRMKDEE